MASQSKEHRCPGLSSSYDPSQHTGPKGKK
jgi:hypothetical protein